VHGDGAPGRLALLLAPFVDNARNADLRRAQLSFAAAWSAEWAFTVALSVVAFRDGGPAAVGLVAAARLLPSAVAAPLLLPFTDRFRRERVLATVSGVRALATAGAAAVVATGGPPWAVYAAAIAATLVGTLFRPVHSALLPSLCHRPHELAGANAVRGLLDSLAVLVGPAVAAVLLHVQGLTAVFVATALGSATSAVLVLRVRSESPARAAGAVAGGLAADLLRGIRVIVRDRDLATLIGLGAVQTVVRGALTVFSVVVAIDVLDAGDPGVGVLTAAVGAGAVFGSIAVARLVRTRRLARWFGIGIALWGAPLVLVGLTSSLPVACLLLAVVGLGNALVDIGLFTLLARLSDEDMSARVFGVLEGVAALGVATGSLLAPGLIRWVGVRPALAAIGTLAPVAVVMAWSRLRVLDRSLVVREDAIDLLRAVPMLRSLSLPLIEQLARHLSPVEVAAGQLVFAQGDPGDRFYVIRNGTADVVGDGTTVRALVAGDGFGEIALLRDVPRTASVRATAPLLLEALDRHSFLHVVTGYRPSAHQAAADVQAKLEWFTPTEPTAP